MKSEQALSIEEMKHLAALGIDISNASLCWTQDPNGEIRTLNLHDEYCYESCYMNPVPAFTLQDLLDLLPDEIPLDDPDDRYGSKTDTCWLSIDLADKTFGYYYEDISYSQRHLYHFEKYLVSPLEGAYKMLLWCIEKGFVKAEGGGK